MITSIDQLDFSKRYSYADYLTWKFSERVELIKGWLFKMSPGASMKHQQVSLNLGSALHQALRGSKCKVFQAPFDVRFLNASKSTNNKEIFDVVQPDLFIVCDPNKIDDKGCVGAPDVVFEILSKGNTKRDTIEKFELYQEHLVKEYWIISPQDEIVNVFDLKDNQFVFRSMYARDAIIPVMTLENISVNGEDLFEE